MALSDYYLCDQCGGKAFYDANLQYESQPDGTNKLGYVGDMAAICDDCAKQHKVIIVAKSQPDLVTELRALAERMDWGDCPSYWLDPIKSLLAAHDAQQAEGKG